MNRFSTPLRSPELEPHDQMQVSVIHRTPIFLGALALCSGYSQCILSPTDRWETFM